MCLLSKLLEAFDEFKLCFLNFFKNSTNLAAVCLIVPSCCVWLSFFFFFFSGKCWPKSSCTSSRSFHCKVASFAIIQTTCQRLRLFLHPCLVLSSQKIKNKNQFEVILNISYPLKSLHCCAYRKRTRAGPISIERWIILTCNRIRRRVRTRLIFPVLLSRWAPKATETRILFDRLCLDKHKDYLSARSLECWKQRFKKKKRQQKKAGKAIRF